MSEKYYRLLDEEDHIQIGDQSPSTWMDGRNLELRDVPGKWVGMQNTNAPLIFRPVILPQVGWLPIGEKKEFEQGTFFGVIKEDRVLRIVSTIIGLRPDESTHYLPPLPVLDGVKEENPISDEPFIKTCLREIGESQTNDVLKARISELEESLRKAEEQTKSIRREAHELDDKLNTAEMLLEAQTTWQELATFEGMLPKRTVLCNPEGDCYTLDATAEDEKSTLLDPKYWLAQHGMTHYYIVPEFKPDNSARIAELVSKKEALLKDHYDCEWLTELRQIDAELAKLKEQSK